VLAFGREDLAAEGGTAMRFGLFGTGPWAHLAHAPALAKHDGVEFAGVWGRDETKAAALAAEYGARAYPSVESLIEAVDAVAIALPPDVQAPIALRAARAGRHLLLDKPVAFTAAAADEIAAAVAAGNLASAVFFTRRFLPETVEFLDRAAATGGWIEARVDQVGSIFTEGNPFGASPWRRASGGLWDVGPHATALVLPVMGPVTEVTAMTGSNDMTHVLLRHESGGISTLTLSLDAPPAAGRQEAMFAGPGGIVRMPTEPADALSAFGLALDELIATAAGKMRTPIDVRLGAHVTAVLAAAAAAARTGRVVPLDG
jgi:predicted dehydrogenase